MSYSKLNIKLKDIQNNQLEMLIEFDRICKKHNINYQLFAGSLLGAVRHQGFIPWDDDIDVVLLRKDYEKLINICNTELKSDYFLQTIETDKNYIMQFAKIRKNNTVFMQKITSEDDIHQGIFIDIFPLDNVKPDTLNGELQQKLSRVLQAVNLRRIKMYSISTKNPVKKVINYVIYYFLKLIPKKYTDNLLEKILTMFEGHDTKYVTHLTNDGTKNKYNKNLRNKKEFNKTINGKFEGYSIPIPKNYDEVLIRLFGDYMTLPPIEEQKSHHGIIEVKLKPDE